MKTLSCFLLLLASSLAWSVELDLVESVDGFIFDADNDRLLYADSDNNMRILDRNTRVETTIFNPELSRPGRAFLTPRGAIFSGVQVNDYADGVLTSFTGLNSRVSLKVSGDYALWNEGPILIRRNLRTGRNIVITDVAGNIDNDVAPNGSVAYWSSIDFGTPTQDYNIFLYQDGSATRLTDATNVTNVYPVTDGSTTVWRYDRSEIHMIGPDGFEVLRPYSSSRDEPNPPFDYLVNNGRVVFTAVRDSGAERVTLRLPNGDRVPVSNWGNYHIESLSDSGMVSYTDNSTAPEDARYLYVENFGVSRVNIDGGRGFWVGEQFFVAREGELYAATVPLAPSSPRTVHCVNDANGDGVADIAVVMPDSSVVIRDFNDRPVASFAFTSIAQIIDIEVMPDTNRNGAAELAALGSGPVRAEIRDSLTGAQLGIVGFDSGAVPIDLELVGDQDGNGSLELSALGRDPVSVETHDALNPAIGGNVLFSSYVVPLDLEVYPGFNGETTPNLAVLATIGGRDQGDKLEIRSLASGALVREIYLSKKWQALQQEPLADINGNGYPEAAVLRTLYDGPLNHVVIRDTGPGKARLGIISFDRNFPPQKLLTISDINGNGAAELAVYGQHVRGSSQKIQIKDSKSRRNLGAVFFDRNFVGIDVTSCADTNGNGSDELVLLGERADMGKLRAIVKDSKTGELLGKINF